MSLTCFAWGTVSLLAIALIGLGIAAAATVARQTPGNDASAVCAACAIVQGAALLILSGGLLMAATECWT